MLGFSHSEQFDIDHSLTASAGYRIEQAPASP